MYYHINVQWRAQEFSKGGGGINFVNIIIHLNKL